MVPATATASGRLDAQSPEYLDIDGRRVAYATYGDPEGRPVVFCHGTPGSRLLARLLDAPATRRGVRVLAPDRPGVGESGRTQRLLGWLSRTAPWLAAPLFGLQRRALARGDPDDALALVADGRPETDALSADEVARLVKADVLEATAGGPSGVVRELGLLSSPWPIALDSVSVPVTVFHGRYDTNAGSETGEALVRRLPDATLERVDSDHLGTLCVAAPRALSGPTPV